MGRKWDREKRIKYVKSMEWCRENDLTIDFRRGDIYTTTMEICFYRERTSTRLLKSCRKDRKIKNNR